MTRLVSVQGPEGRTLGLFEDAGLYRLPGFEDVGQWLASGTPLAGVPEPIQDGRILAPLALPPKIMAVGLNYAEHAHEQAKTAPSFPKFFAKGRTCICGPDDPILLPPGREEIDVEVELVVVIGTHARNLSVADAMSCVYGFTIGNDVSDRQAQKEDGQFYRAKSFESFGPIGPWVVPKEEFDHRKGFVRLYRNNELFQDGDLSQLVFSVERLISELSIIHTLEPGDLIFTGTPSGVGAHRTPPVWLQTGDVIRCEIEGLGTLENPVSRGESEGGRRSPPLRQRG